MYNLTRQGTELLFAMNHATTIESINLLLIRPVSGNSTLNVFTEKPPKVFEMNFFDVL